MLKLTEQFKDILKESDLENLNSEIIKMVSDKVSLKVEDAVKKVQTEEKAKYETLLEEKENTIKEALMEEYDLKIEELESKVVDSLDKFLDAEISENISESLLEDVALNETLKPLVAGIKNLFEEKHVELDTEGYTLIKEAKEEIENLETKVSEKISDYMEIKTENETLKKQKLISESVDGLSDEQKESVNMFFEDKDLSEVESKISNYVEMLIEEDTSKSKSKKREDGFSDGDGDADGKRKGNINEDVKIRSKAGTLL